MAAPPLTVLVTGFGPFPGAPVNPTAALAAALARRRRPALAGVRLIDHVFPVTYAAVESELPALLARHRPAVLLMFGLAGRTPHLRIETRARTRLSLLFVDAAGARRGRVTCRAFAAQALMGRAPFMRLVKAARTARVPARLSCDAGRYLCNYAYRLALETREPRPAMVVFVHVPRVRRAGRTGRPDRAGISAAALLRAGEAILLALAAAARSTPTRPPLRGGYPPPQAGEG